MVGKGIFEYLSVAGFNRRIYPSGAEILSRIWWGVAWPIEKSGVLHIAPTVLWTPDQGL